MKLLWKFDEIKTVSTILNAVRPSTGLFRKIILSIGFWPKRFQEDNCYRRPKRPAREYSDRRRSRARVSEYLLARFADDDGSYGWLAWPSRLSRSLAIRLVWLDEVRPAACGCIARNGCLVVVLLEVGTGLRLKIGEGDHVVGVDVDDSEVVVEYPAVVDSSPDP